MKWKKQIVNWICRLLNYELEEKIVYKKVGTGIQFPLLTIKARTPITEEHLDAEDGYRDFIVKADLMNEFIKELDKHKAIEYNVVHEDKTDTENIFVEVEIKVVKPELN